jgi:hypothetical protein
VQYHQHVIDWYRSRGYRVTVLTDWSLMCVSEAVYLQTDPERLADAMSRQHRLTR